MLIAVVLCKLHFFKMPVTVKVLLIFVLIMGLNHWSHMSTPLNFTSHWSHMRSPQKEGINGDYENFEFWLVRLALNVM